tara:strand:+ start:1194 stop:1514 length:321 start_codon:yes stop_codon:yes gene_type:complete
MINIKYEIFQKRKNFNIIKWLRIHPDSNYQDFTNFLACKSVIAPSESYFNESLELFKSTRKRTELFEENKKTEIVVDKKVNEDEVKNVEKPVTSKRRARKKKTNEN